jgi:uncharacterized protein (TIGR03437 family)
MKWLLLLAASAPLFAQQCTYSVTPQQFTIGPGAYTDQIAVTTQAGCPWSFATDSAWITFNSPPANNQTTGTGTVNFTAAASANPALRIGHIAVAAVNVAIVQSPPVCTLALQAPLSASFPITGGSGNIAVQSNCLWNASSNQSWIAIPAAGNAGTGNGPLPYTVAANSCVATRSGTVTVQSQQSVQFQINQDGSAANLTIAPTTLTAPPAGATGTLKVNTGDGCAWSAFSDVTWMQITASSSGTGAGVIAYNIGLNTGPARTGNIHVGSLVFAVTQQAPPPPGPQLTAVQNAASGPSATNAVSPGEIVSLFGSNFGPASPATLQVAPGGHSITTSLSNTQVFFDGIAAALTYASATQINAVVPYAVSGSTKVQVVYQGSPTNTMQFPVQAAAPGVFSLDASGTGTGAILNQDNSVNGPTRPASQGSIVQIFCTGGGVTNPASADASITGTPLPLLTQTISVMIGGANAQVKYSGGAPSAVAGLTQINAVVPQGITPGNSVPVIVIIGGVSSQAGLTLTVN